MALGIGRARLHGRNSGRSRRRPLEEPGTVWVVVPRPFVAIVLPATRGVMWLVSQCSAPAEELPEFFSRRLLFPHVSGGEVASVCVCV